MSLESLNFLLQQVEESQGKNLLNKSGKIDLQTPFGLNDLMFDVNETHSCDQDITSPMSLLRLDSQKTNECPNISDYINRHLSLLSTDEPKPSVVDKVKTVQPKLPLSNKSTENSLNIIKCKDKSVVQHKSGCVKKFKILHTKSLANVRKSPLEKPDSGLSLTMGRKYPKSSSNLMNDYLYRVLVKTRSQGFKFNTPSPDEAVLSWMDFVRQMPSK